MERQALLERSSFRALSASELDAVAGGTIIVTSQRISDINAFLAAHGDGAGGLGGGNPFASLGGFVPGSIDADAIADLADGPPNPAEELSEEEQFEAATKMLDGMEATLEDAIKKYGDFDMELPDGQKFKASEVLKGLKWLGHAGTALELYTMATDWSGSNSDVAEAVGFFAALGATVGLSIAGAPALVTFVAGLAIGYGVTIGVEWALDGGPARAVDSIMSMFIPSQPVAPDSDATPTTPHYEFWRDLLNPYDWPSLEDFR